MNYGHLNIGHTEKEDFLIIRISFIQVNKPGPLIAIHQDHFRYNRLLYKKTQIEITCSTGKSENRYWIFGRFSNVTAFSVFALFKGLHTAEYVYYLAYGNIQQWPMHTLMT